jgi:hypothetical protein
MQAITSGVGFRWISSSSIMIHSWPGQVLNFCPGTAILPSTHGCTKEILFDSIKSIPAADENPFILIHKQV